MTKFWNLCIVAFCLVVAVGIGVLARQADAIERETRPFVEAAIPAITSTWDQQALLDRASPALKTKAMLAKLKRVFPKAVPLGALVSFEPPASQALVLRLMAPLHDGLTRYVTKAKFQNGDAMVNITLVKADGRWMINRFRVDVLRPTATGV